MGFSGGAPIDRDVVRTDSASENRSDLVAAQRRQVQAFVGQGEPVVSAYQEILTVCLAKSLVLTLLQRDGVELQLFAIIGKTNKAFIAHTKTFQ